MQLIYYFFSFLFFYEVNFILAAEYIYPVASLNDNIILYIYQNSPYAIQLFQFNIVTNDSEQILWSLFKPAQVQLLPNNQGFSFIDNGRLRIKSFEKRSPKTVDFHEPIFNINGLRWIDEHTCYCSAEYNNHWSLFQLQDNGKVDYLVCSQDEDCVYPQKVDEKLFYIECKKNRSNNFNYAIMQTIYDKQVTPECIMSFYDESIIFLYMLSENEGFVIGYEKEHKEADLAHFFYYHLVHEKKIWHKNFIFSFSIPTYLFLGNKEDRLFESIIPLLPRIIDNKIYFVDCTNNENNFLELYYYDLSIMTHNKVDMEEKNSHVFVPIKCGAKLYCGGNKKGVLSPFFVF